MKKAFTFLLLHFEKKCAIKKYNKNLKRGQYAKITKHDNNLLFKQGVCADGG